MPLFRPSELVSFLASIHQSAKPMLSQNFLVDGNIVHKILTALQPLQNIPVVEIGPGPGVVTEQLLALGMSVIAIEKDTSFAKELVRLDPHLCFLQVIQADILQWALHHQAYVVSNIPYHITTPILEWLMDHAQYIPRAVVMVQLEVAQKICGRGKPMYTHMALSFFFSNNSCDKSISQFIFA